MVSRRGVLLLLPLLAVVASCDGPEEYSSVTVHVVVDADGTGSMSWSVAGQHAAAEMADYGQRFAAALGLPPPAIDPAHGGARFTGLATDSLVLDVGRMVSTIAELLPDDARSLFVSVCTPHRMGRVDAGDMASVHWGSCATFTRKDGSTDGPHPTATVHFGARRHPATVPFAVASAAFALGIGAFALARLRASRPWTFALVLFPVAGFVVCAWVAWWSLTAGTDDATFSTRPSLDPEFDSGFSRVSLFTFCMSVTLLACWAVDTALRRRARRRE